MKLLRSAIMLAGVAILVACSTDTHVEEVDMLIAEADSALANGQPEAAYSRYRNALTTEPHRAIIHWHVARTAARIGRDSIALAHLEILARGRAPYDPAGDTLFASLVGTADFMSLNARFTENRTPVGASGSIDSLLGQPIESIVHYPRPRLSGGEIVTVPTMVAGCANHGRFYRRVGDSEAWRLDSRIHDNHYGMFGGLTTSDSSAYYFCMTLMDFESIRPGEYGRSRLYRQRLTTETSTGVLPPPEMIAPIDTTARLYFNDLIELPDGRLLITAFEDHSLWQFDPTSDSLTPFDLQGRIVHPNGITLGPDGRTVYVSAYFDGLYQFTLDERISRPMEIEPWLLATGIDGLHYHDGGLIAIQNIDRLNRVVKYHFTSDQSTIDSLTVLAANLDYIGVPTTGTIVGDTLIYVANRAWRGESTPAIIARVALN